MSHLHELAEENADLQREVTTLREDLLSARSSAIRWETECHKLRAELNALRQNRPTDRIDLEPHDLESHG